MIYGASVVGRKKFKKAQAKMNTLLNEWADNIVPASVPVVKWAKRPIKAPEPDVEEFQIPMGGVEINIDVLMALCELQKKMNSAKFKKVVEYFMTGARVSVTEASKATKVSANHVGKIVNRLLDAGYLRVWRGHGGSSGRHKVNRFMLVGRPEFEPLYQLDYGPRPHNVAWDEFPRWADDIGPLIDAYGGYTRRLK